MSYFKKGIIYIIVPTVDITNEMINNSKANFNSNPTTLRKSNDGTLTLFKLERPISSAFDGYVWYNEDDILVEMEKSEWVGLSV